jgi:internalin A
MLRVAMATVVIFICETNSFAQDERNTPMLPMEVLVPWKIVGASVGWMGVGQYEALNFEECELGKDGHVPAFKLATWKAGILNGLADPGTEFGLDLSEMKLTDAEMKDVGRLTSLHSLDIRRSPRTDTGITDTGIQELAALQSLKALNLPFVNVSDVGLKYVCKIKTLELLNLRGTKVSDVGMEEIGSLKGLKSLDLTYVPVTDAGLIHLRDLSALQTLFLFKTNISDAGLKHLSKLKNLRYLSLCDTNITDAGLTELVGLDSLKHLSLTGTKVTDRGIAKLQKSLPNTRIARYQNVP